MPSWAVELEPKVTGTKALYLVTNHFHPEHNLGVSIAGSTRWQRPRTYKLSPEAAWKKSGI